MPYRRPADRKRKRLTGTGRRYTGANLSLSLACVWIVHLAVVSVIVRPEGILKETEKEDDDDDDDGGINEFRLVSIPGVIRRRIA